MRKRMLRELVAGRLVAVLKDHESESAGRHEVVWQGRIVSESAVSARIAALRKAVGDSGRPTEGTRLRIYSSP